jgi:hypothetical protein
MDGGASVADTVWGDDFASDGLFELVAVSQWAQLAEGESVRLFPALIVRFDELDPELSKRVFERADQIDEQASRLASEEVAGPRKRSRASRANKGLWPKPTREDAIWLRSLIAARDVRNRVTDLRMMARFAFLTGLHPAYMWSDVEVLPGWGATAAWLGEFSRHHRAFMPPEVAEYFVDALSPIGGTVVMCDDALSPLLCDVNLPPLLLTAAKRRLAGRNPVVRREIGHISEVISRLGAARRRAVRMIANFSKFIL